MKTTLIPILFSLSVCYVHADCVQISDPEVQPGDSDLPAVSWQAEFKNECDAYVDVTVNVDLMNAENEAIYSLSAVESFGFRESRKIGKEAYVPKHIAEEVADIKVSTEESQRP